MKTAGDEKQASGTITHVFVLMMENRSFDHMLGFAGLSGPDAATGKPTRADDLVENPHSNVDPNEPGTQVPAASPAELKLYPPDVDPGQAPDLQTNSAVRNAASGVRVGRRFAIAIGGKRREERNHENCLPEYGCRCRRGGAGRFLRDERGRGVSTRVLR